MLGSVLHFMYTFATWLALFAVFFGVALRFGIDSLRLTVISLYMATLVWMVFPFRDAVLAVVGDSTASRIGLFLIFLCIMVWVLSRMIGRSYEGVFEFFLRKALYAAAASLLSIAIMKYTLFVAAPFFDTIPLVSFFSDPSYVFFWFIAPLVLILFW